MLGFIITAISNSSLGADGLRVRVRVRARVRVTPTRNSSLGADGLGLAAADDA